MQQKVTSARAAIIDWTKRLTKRLEGENSRYPGVLLPHGDGRIDRDYGRDDEKPDFVKRDDANFEGD